MASVKREQILQEAEKLAARGKLDAAIKEYRRALEGAPHDTNTLNRLGDLLVRVSRIPEAIEVYNRIASHFGDDGFFLKAIAIYKKVNRLDPQRTDTYERLGELYFKQGLTVEGRQQFLTLADWFLRSKDVPEAVRVYRRLIELEPSNFQARAKLVDLLVQAGDAAAVASEIDSLGRSLLSRGLLEEAVKLYHRALELQPDQGDFAAPCVDALVGAGRANQALELAERAMKASRGGPELRRAAARAAVEAGDLTRARNYLEALLPEVGDRTDIIQLYGDVMLRVGEAETAKEHMLPTIDRLLRAGDAGRARALVKRMLRSRPGDPDVLERALKAFDRREDPDLVESIEASLADAHYREGKKLEAGRLYAKLAERRPDSELFAERARELGVEPKARVHAPAPVAPPGASGGDALGSGGELPDLEVVDVDIPWDDGPLPTTEEGAAVAAPAEAVALVVSPADTDRIPPAAETGLARVAPPAGPSAADELFTEAQVFAKYGLVEKAILHLQKLLAFDPEHVAGRGLLAALGGGEVTEFVESPPVRPAPGSPGGVDPWAGEVHGGVPAAINADEFVPIDFDADLAATPPVEPAPAVEASIAAIPLVEPPGVETAQQPGPTPYRLAAAVPRDEGGGGEVVRPTAPPAERPRAAASSDIEVVAPPRGGLSSVRLDNLEAMLGLGQVAPEKRPPSRGGFEPLDLDLGALGFAPAARGEAQRPVAAPVTDVPATGAAEVASPVTPAEAEADQVEVSLDLVEVSEVLAGPGSDQLGEIDFFLQQGLLDDAARMLERLRASFGDHPELRSRHAMLKARGWDEERAAAPAASAASELFSEEEQFFDLAAELEKELAEEELVAEATGAGKGSEASIEELFREFQRGVAEQVQQEDYDTHFNLGLAYREMGLLDEAIGEFQLSLKSPDFFIDSVTMIGACYIDKGLPDEAGEWYARALTAPALSSETEIALRYELGRAHEAAGKIVEALACYTDVLSVNPGFRDVVNRVSSLRAN